MGNTHAQSSAQRREPSQQPPRSRLAAPRPCEVRLAIRHFRRPLGRLVASASGAAFWSCVLDLAQRLGEAGDRRWIGEHDDVAGRAVADHIARVVNPLFQQPPGQLVASASRAASWSLRSGSARQATGDGSASTTTRPGVPSRTTVGGSSIRHFGWRWSVTRERVARHVLELAQRLGAAGDWRWIGEHDDIAGRAVADHAARVVNPSFQLALVSCSRARRAPLLELEQRLGSAGDRR
jgi:hypothetical protein